MKKFFAAAITALLLTGCQQAPANSQPTPITFGNKGPIRLNVANINVVENYRPPMALPNVDHVMPTPPIVAIKQWIGQRFIATGSQGAMEVTIDDASVKETMLPKEKGLTGFFTDQQEARYDAHIKITMRVYDGVNAMSQADASVDVVRMHSINEKATVAEREAMFNGMLQEMITQMDNEAELRIRQNFGRYMTQ